MAATYKYVKRWYLEMTEKPFDAETGFPDNCLVRRFSGNTDDYRILNKMVGGDLGWVDRQIMPDDELKKIVQNPHNKIYVLYVNDSLAGFTELDFSVKDEVEMHYFGLIPEFRFKGLGKPFLRWAMQEVWKTDPKKFKLNTCEIDEPAALPFYIKAGFRIVDERIEKQAVIL